jgi:hypothetical protein
MPGVGRSITTGLEFVYNVKVSAGIPVVTQTEVGFGFKVSVTGQYGQENSRTETEEWTYTFSIPARKTIKAIVEMGKADINLEYVATMRVTTTDGSKWVFNMNGAYDGVTYTEATVKVEEFD